VFFVPAIPFEILFSFSQQTYRLFNGPIYPKKVYISGS